MPDQLLFAIETASQGLMAGVLYALVALSFTLIFKSLRILDNAQGAALYLHLHTARGERLAARVALAPRNRTDFRR